MIGVAILATAMFFVSEMGTRTRGGRSDQCSIQLTDPDGGTIEDLSGTSLILPAGGKIEVTVEGNTLYFECPKVAVNARVHVDRGRLPSGGMSTSPPDPSQASDTVPEPLDEAATAETQILISPQPGLQRIRLERPNPQQRWPEFEFQPDDAPEEKPAADASEDVRVKKKPRSRLDGPK